MFNQRPNGSILFNFANVAFDNVNVTVADPGIAKGGCAGHVAIFEKFESECPNERTGALMRGVNQWHALHCITLLQHHNP